MMLWSSLLDAELAKVEAGIDRLRAFETGTMPESICGDRVNELGLRASALRARHQDLADEMEQADLRTHKRGTVGTP